MMDNQKYTEGNQCYNQQPTANLGYYAISFRVTPKQHLTQIWHEHYNEFPDIQLENSKAQAQSDYPECYGN